MPGKIKFCFIMMLFFAVLFNISQPVQAADAAPPSITTAPVPGSQGGGAGVENAYVMNPNARAVLPTDSFDFGEVYEGNDIYHDFIVKNEGTADLNIINVKSG